jgi:hypothetical protein|tara:strand:- start:86 stop:649 length:564 start_codon:yes stop_codon:yes gene_type:complete
MVGSLHTMPLFLIVMFAAEEGYIDNDPATRDLYFIVPSFFLWFVYLFVLPRLVPSKFAAKFAAQQLKNEKDYEKRQKKESTKKQQLKKEKTAVVDERTKKLDSIIVTATDFIPGREIEKILGNVQDTYPFSGAGFTQKQFEMGLKEKALKLSADADAIILYSVSMGGLGKSGVKQIDGTVVKLKKEE